MKYDYLSHYLLTVLFVSCRYHRILKREKVKQQLKDFEQLQKTNPEAALKKLEELDKTRAQERASLRHKNTGKWARNLAVRAKYDKDVRLFLFLAFKDKFIYS